VTGQDRRRVEGLGRCKEETWGYDQDQARVQHHAPAIIAISNCARIPTTIETSRSHCACIWRCGAIFSEEEGTRRWVGRSRLPSWMSRPPTSPLLHLTTSFVPATYVKLSSTYCPNRQLPLREAIQPWLSLKRTMERSQATKTSRWKMPKDSHLTRLCSRQRR